MREDAERLVKELAELIELAHGTAGNAEGTQRHEQLVAIGRTVGELEKKGIPVPDDLRRLKTGLAAGLTEYEESSEALSYLRTHLPPLVRALGVTLGETGGRSRAREVQGRSLSGHITPMGVLGGWIVDALTALGGAGSRSDVTRWIQQQHHDDLLPADRELDSGGQPRFLNRLSQQRFKMTKIGRLKNDSPGGLWELPDEG